ncbi:hypothetical protein Droror1_Dr00026546 [Drosera rotundifolia]
MYICFPSVLLGGPRFLLNGFGLSPHVVFRKLLTYWLGEENVDIVLGPKAAAGPPNNTERNAKQIYTDQGVFASVAATRVVDGAETAGCETVNRVDSSPNVTEKVTFMGPMPMIEGARGRGEGGDGGIGCGVGFFT